LKKGLIKMIQARNVVENNKWVIYYASMMQEAWKKEIEAAIKAVDVLYAKS